MVRTKPPEYYDKTVREVIMALGICATRVDERGYELVEHGTAMFPIAVYHDDLGKEEVIWHWHEELEAALITEGRALVAAGEKRQVLGPGEGFFVNSGVLHGCWDVDFSGCRFHSMVFHPRLVGGGMDSVFYQRYVSPLEENRAVDCVFLRPEEPWQKEALEAMEEAWQACVHESPGYEFRVRNAMSALVFGLWSHMPRENRQTDARALRSGSRIKEMLGFIHDNFAGELDTGKIAASVSVSRSEALRCFRATIGTTPIQYVKQYRLQRAAQMLASTGLPVSDIAAGCGFQDMSYFTKSFRELKGCTPTEYRKKHTEP